MQQPQLIYRNFEIFDEPLVIQAFTGKHNSTFFIFSRNNYDIYMHLEDFERAWKAYIRIVAKKDYGALNAKGAKQAWNSFGFPEYILYGYQWVAHKFDNSNNREQFLVAFRWRFTNVLELLF